MNGKVQRSTSVTADSCTDEMKVELILGPPGENESAFPSRAAHRRTWEAVREELVHSCGLFRRPAAWWQYEAPPRMDWPVSEAESYCHEPPENYFERLGLCTPAESECLRKLRLAGLILPGPVMEPPPLGFVYRKPEGARSMPGEPQGPWAELEPGRDCVINKRPN
jgi:hypothetical protein